MRRFWAVLITGLVCPVHAQSTADAVFERLTLEQRASQLIMMWTLSRTDDGYALKKPMQEWVRDVGITNNEWGRPLIIWSERGRGVCERLGIGKGHVSLTDDAGLVIACAVVEAAE